MCGGVSSITPQHISICACIESNSYAGNSMQMHELRWWGIFVVYNKLSKAEYCGSLWCLLVKFLNGFMLMFWLIKNENLGLF